MLSSQTATPSHEPVGALLHAAAKKGGCGPRAEVQAHARSGLPMDLPHVHVRMHVHMRIGVRQPSRAMFSLSRTFFWSLGPAEIRVTHIGAIA